MVVDGADVPGWGNRESVWIGPARRHAPSVAAAARGGYLVVWAMLSGFGPGGGFVRQPLGAVTLKLGDRIRERKDGDDRDDLDHVLATLSFAVVYPDDPSR